MIKWADENLADHFGNPTLLERLIVGALGMVGGGRRGGRLGRVRAGAMGGAARGCLLSFSADTHVLLADGTTKPISEIKVGDNVLATDPETGETAPQEVTAVWVHDDTLVDLEVANGAVITTTEDHPFWNATDHQWQQAQTSTPATNSSPQQVATSL